MTDMTYKCNAKGCKNNPTIAIKYKEKVSFSIYKLNYMAFCTVHLELAKDVNKTMEGTLTPLWNAKEGYQIQNKKMYSPVFETITEVADAWNRAVCAGLVALSGDDL